MSNKDIRNEVILRYRDLIEDRYQYGEISKKHDLPASFDKGRVTLFRTFFLENIYPHPDKREELDEAFQRLDTYIKQPEKLLPILLSSARLLFKYGRHLPKILTAGIRALRSFRKATEFENSLVKSAIQKELKPPFSKDIILDLIKTLPPKEIDLFIDSCQTLFETLHDRVLVKKIKEIVTYLIDVMEKRPDLYEKEEVNGLKIGSQIVMIGDTLFDELSKEDQHRVFKVIIQIERDFLEGVFAQK